jgi:hypothetical protein
MKKKKESLESILVKLKETRWQMITYPNEHYIANTNKLLKLTDQFIDLHNREIHPEKYKLHCK